MKDIKERVKSKKIVFGLILAFSVLVCVESVLRIAYFTKDKLMKKAKTEWNYDEYEKELTNIHKENRKDVQKFGSFVQFSNDLYVSEGDKYYKPKPNSSIVVIRNERIGYMLFPLDDKIRELLKHFKGEIYYKNFDSLSLRKTGKRNISEGIGSNISIVTAGDSFTEGCYVNDEETFSACLESFGNSEGSNIVVSNMGVSGYSTAEEYFRIVDLAPHKKIDILILNYFPNDINVAEHKVVGYWEAKEPQSKLGKWVFRNIFVARLMMEGWFSIFSRPFNPEKNKEIKEGWKKSFYFLNKIKEVCDKHGATFFLSAIPPKEQFSFGKKEFYQIKLQNFCNEKDIFFLDPYDNFEKNDLSTLYLDWDPHFTKKGHKVYGKYLYDEIKPYLKK